MIELEQISQEVSDAYMRLSDAVDECGETACMSAPDIYFTDMEDRNSVSLRAYAKKQCADCPVKNLCLEYALVANETHGVWGGTTAKERKDLRRRLRAPRASA